MPGKAVKPKQPKWVVAVRDSRWLVEADSELEAKRTFLSTMPRGRFYGRAVDGEIRCHLATDVEVLEFRGRRRGKPPETMTLPMDLPEPTRKRKATGA